MFVFKYNFINNQNIFMFINFNYIMYNNIEYYLKNSLLNLNIIFLILNNNKI